MEITTRGRIPDLLRHRAELSPVLFAGLRLTEAFLLLALFVAASGSQAAPGCRVLRSDAFKGKAHSSFDPKWPRDPGADAWGDHELETYADTAQNAFLDGGGHPIIRLIRAGGRTLMSGRLKTAGKFDVTYGRMRAPIKPAFGEDVRPAFRVLRAAAAGAAWPVGGGGVRRLGCSGGEGSLRRRYPRARWVPDRPFVLLLRVASGGWPGGPSSTTILPQGLLVDWAASRSGWRIHPKRANESAGREF